MHWDKHAVTIGLDVVTHCRPNILATLKELLDNYHGESRTLEYYDLLASDWLEPFTHLVYVAMQDVLTENRHKESIPIPVSADIAIAKTHFLNTKFHDHLRWVVQSLSENGSYHDWQFEMESVEIINSRRKPLTLSLTKSFSTSKPDVLVTGPYFKCSRFEWLSALWQWRSWLAWDDFTYPIRILSCVDTAWRKEQALTNLLSISLTELVQMLLPLHVPVVLLEGFAEYRKAVLAFPVSRPKVVYSANYLHDHFAFKLLIAEWQKEGTVLLYHQHGGNYGIDRLHTLEEFETRVADRYYTFGWRNIQPHIKPLSPPMIRAPKRPSKGMLLCCEDFYKVVYRLHFLPMPGTIETLHEETCEFLTRLPNRKHLLVRPYTQDYGWGTLEMMRKAAPDAEFDDRKKSSFTRFAESRLVIHNHLGTAWLETLALDIPTVCFYDIETYEFREDAQPYLDVLAKVGVLHRSGNSAAVFVASLDDEIEKWWHKAQTQEARRNFVEKYANFSPDWKEQWEQEFKEVLNAVCK